MRILFLAPHLSTGGMPAFLLRRIESLVNKENIELFVVEYSNISDHFVVQKNKIKSLIKPENFFTLGEDKGKLIDIIKDNKIDIVHADEILDGFGQSISTKLLSEIYDNNRTWRVVETCHNVWFNPDTSKRFHPDAYAFCTPYHKEVSFSRMPSYSEVIQFPIENKVPSNEDKIKSMTILGLDPSKKHILNVGLWTSGKNQGEGVEIARMLEFTNPEIQFHFVGNQAMNFEEYWGPIMKNLPSNVNIWGERSDISEFMKACDVFMFNSTWECNPLVLKESISHGMKIISRNLPQYLTMFTPYITEIDGDISSTKDKLIELINNNQQYKVYDESFYFKNSYINFYKKVINLPITNNTVTFNKPVINCNFIGNPFIEIKGESDSNFKIEFHDDLGICHYSNNLPINHWVRLNREYYTKWTAKVWENGTLIYDYTLDLKNKSVYIALESSSLGDTLAWIPYVKEFKDKHECDVIVSTFMNNLFIETYPDIKFVTPGTPVNNIHAMYRIGWYYNEDGTINTKRNPVNFRTQPLQKVACDILGLEYKEIRPILKLKEVNKLKKVGIGIHSTAQSKYWNNPNGWQEVVNYLNSKGYEVVLYSKENDGHMGNKHPMGITKFNGDGSIESVIDDLLTCEFFIGIGSGLSWLSWSVGLPTIIISGFSDEYSETKSNTWRVINKSVCHGCFNWNRLDASDWNWCPVYKGSDRAFECSKEISSKMVIEKIEDIL